MRVLTCMYAYCLWLRMCVSLSMYIYTIYHNLFLLLLLKYYYSVYIKMYCIYYLFHMSVYMRGPPCYPFAVLTIKFPNWWTMKDMPYLILFYLINHSSLIACCSCTVHSDTLQQTNPPAVSMLRSRSIKLKKYSSNRSENTICCLSARLGFLIVHLLFVICSPHVSLCAFSKATQVSNEHVEIFI